MSKLKVLKIEHYKGFFKEESIDFAIPDNQKNGSGLTLIVGPNNTGKTSVIEALLLKDSKRFKESERHKNDNPPKITIISDATECIFSNIDGGSQIQRVKESQPHEIAFEVVQSRRFWNYQSGSNWDTQQFLNQTTEHEIRTAGGVDTAAVLKEVNKIAEQKNKFNGLMKRIVPHFTGWTIDTNDQGDYVKYITANTAHQANFLGDGIMSIFRICAHLVSDDKNRVLIIDEPELSLHPSAQKALSQILSESSRDRQVILCTHSPYLVNWQDFINGAKFIRLNKINDENCTVSKLDNAKNYVSFIDHNFIEWQKPQLLDIVAKEILFSEKVLFVEGQEDVGLIRKWAGDNSKDLNFEVFGYGVGSYSNMKLFLEMAQDLGLSKVAALYDSGSGADSSFEKDKEIFKEYYFEKLPTSDIRDKWFECPECDTKKMIKDGCFDKSGKMKQEKAEEFASIMENFITYFK